MCCRCCCCSLSWSVAFVDRDEKNNTQTFQIAAKSALPMNDYCEYCILRKIPTFSVINNHTHQICTPAKVFQRPPPPPPPPRPSMIIMYSLYFVLQHFPLWRRIAPLPPTRRSAKAICNSHAVRQYGGGPPGHFQFRPSPTGIKLCYESPFLPK